MTDVWATIAAERGALADDLVELTPAQWAAPSLCAGWTVRDIVAHLSATASLNPATFFLGIAKSRFNFDKFANDQIAKHRGPDPPPPWRSSGGCRIPPLPRRVPKISWLGEVVIHGADVRRALGIAHTYTPWRGAPGDRLLQGLEHAHRRQEPHRRAGLAATDDDWRHGQGEAVEGPLLSLLLATTGRAAACDDLIGPGVPTLRSRCAPAGLAT